jgi:hypothetical protein
MALTDSNDRPVAIAGLEFRLSSFYNTSSVYGVVEKHFGESLLWVRSKNKRALEPIGGFESNDVET